MSLSRVTLTTKERFKDGTPARFTWKSGDDGPAPSLGFSPGPALSGQITGTLTSDNYVLPSGRYAKIEFDARFIAAEGALGSNRQISIAVSLRS